MFRALLSLWLIFDFIYLLVVIPIEIVLVCIPPVFPIFIFKHKCPLDKHHIAVRFGHFYAHRAIRDLGLADRDGVVRVSMVHYNTLEEVDRLTAFLDEIL